MTDVYASLAPFVDAARAEAGVNASAVMVATHIMDNNKFSQERFMGAPFMWRGFPKVPAGPACGPRAGRP